MPCRRAPPRKGAAGGRSGGQAGREAHVVVVFVDVHHFPERRPLRRRYARRAGDVGSQLGDRSVPAPERFEILNHALNGGPVGRLERDARG